MGNLLKVRTSLAVLCTHLLELAIRLNDQHKDTLDADHQAAEAEALAVAEAAEARATDFLDKDRLSYHPEIEPASPQPHHHVAFALPGGGGSPTGYSPASSASGSPPIARSPSKLQDHMAAPALLHHHHHRGQHHRSSHAGHRITGLGAGHRASMAHSRGSMVHRASSLRNLRQSQAPNPTRPTHAGASGMRATSNKPGRASFVRAMGRHGP